MAVNTVFCIYLSFHHNLLQVFLLISYPYTVWQLCALSIVGNLKTRKHIKNHLKLLKHVFIFSFEKMLCFSHIFRLCGIPVVIWWVIVICLWYRRSPQAPAATPHLIFTQTRNRKYWKQTVHIPINIASKVSLLNCWVTLKIYWNILWESNHFVYIRFDINVYTPIGNFHFFLFCWNISFFLM